MPVGNVPEVGDIETAAIFSPGASFLQATDAQTMLSGTQWTWWEAREPSSIAVEVTIIEMPTANLALEPVDTRRNGGWGEPTDGEWPEYAVLGNEIAEAANQLQIARVQFPHGRLLIQATVGLGPAHLAAVENGEKPTIDEVETARLLALQLAESVPVLPDLTGWEGAGLAHERLFPAAHAGIALMLILIARELGFWLLDRGSQEALVGAVRPKVSARPEDVILSGSARRIRFATFVKTISVAVLAGCAFMMLFFLGFPFPVTLAIGATGAAVITFAWSMRKPHAGADADLSGKWRLAFAAAASVGAATLVAGAYLIAAGVSILSITVDVTFFLASLLTILIGILLLPLAPLPPRLVKRLATPSVRAAIAEDSRPSILHLPSVYDSKLRVRVRPGSRTSVAERVELPNDGTFEDLVAWSALRFGAVSTLVQPGTKRRRLGATQEDVSDDEWEELAIDRMDSASAIIFVVDSSTSAAWAVEQIVVRGKLSNTVFVFPPVSRGNTNIRLAHLCVNLGTSYMEVYEGVGPLAKPLVAVRVDDEGRLIRYFADGRDDVAYKLCLDHALVAAQSSQAQVSQVANLHWGQKESEETREALAELVEESRVPFDPKKGGNATPEPFTRALFFLGVLGRMAAGKVEG